jgi:hypothetical protein
MAIRKVLLPLQSAVTAEAAFATALMVTRRWRAHLAVLHVIADRTREGAVRKAFERLTAANGLTVADAKPNADKPTASFATVVGREADVVAYEACFFL